ncbi:MAG TPA: hypothetical protein VMZ28_29795 [Kofleriaceae bacterium]|nr:hypothetical protein [Kofleriaceae bacterium]
MPFRSQAYRERCGSCDAFAADAACPRCRAPVCATHACDPYGCCEPCATEMYFAVSKAGRRHIVGGGALAFVSTIGLYALYALRVFPPLAAGLLVAGLATSFAVMMWGGSISPRLAELSLKRKFVRLRGGPLAAPLLPP